ncbi:RDD family protein [Caballeronia pedi]|nr:RDD family protein [Caballeronia pedi]
MRAPTLRRRLATMLYEGVILFGVVFLAGYLFSTLTQQRNGLTNHNWLMSWIGIVLAAYFVYFWTHGGQTLPMKTWRLKVVDTHGQPLRPGRALARYALAWLWFLPPLALHPLFSLAVPQTLAVFAAWVALWAAAARLDPARQFLHDRLAGTRIVAAQPVVK